MLITLVGNKTDLLELREVSIEDAALFASENGLLYFETSARSGTNVNQVFTEIGTVVVNKKCGWISDLLVFDS